MGEYLRMNYEKIEPKITPATSAKLFTIGPVEMFPNTAAVRLNGYIYFRTQEYSNIVNTCLRKLADLIGNKEDFATIYLASSGTGAMEAVVENCVTSEDKALVINGGTFGKRFCELLKHHEVPYESINLDWNETLSEKHFKEHENKNYTALFVNLHETSTGQLYDINILSEFCKRNNMYLIVDAISTFLADEYDMDKYGVDVTIISSQKGLCLSPGMSVISFSRKMIEKINQNPAAKSLYFDFKDYLKNIARGQTPYTPPVCIMYELQDMLRLIESSGGKRVWLGKIRSKAEYFRAQIKRYGLKIPDYPLSNILTPIFFEDINAYDVIQVLKDKYGLYVNPCGGDLAGKLLRVSHIGNTETKDFDNLLEKILLSIKEVQEKMEAQC